MAVVHPVAGAFGIYAEQYLSPWFGFTIRATYGLVQIVAIDIRTSYLIERCSHAKFGFRNSSRQPSPT
jgi:amino acid permease